MSRIDYLYLAEQSHMASRRGLLCGRYLASIDPARSLLRIVILLKLTEVGSRQGWVGLEPPIVRSSLSWRREFWPLLSRHTYRLSEE